MSFSLATVYTNLAPVLNAANTAAITQGDSDEFYAWFNEALARAARETGMFVERDATLTVTGGSNTVAVPARHLSTLHVARDSDTGDWRALRPASAAEIQALDVDDSTTEDTPTRFIQDREGADTIRVHPTPAADDDLAVIFHAKRADASAGSPTVAGPAALGDYCKYFALGRARSVDGDGGMPEVVEYCAERTALYERIFEQYWGGAQ